MKWSSIRVYRSMEPLTSQTTTSLRGFSLRRLLSMRTSSPPNCAFRRSVLRRSSAGPFPRCFRLVRLTPGFHCREAISCLACNVLLRRELREIPRPEHFPGAERSGQVDTVVPIIGFISLRAGAVR